jgi:hypothetical protein
MKKLSIFIACMLITCLLFTIAAPVQADDEEQDSSLIPENIDIAELEVDRMELVPSDTSDRKVKLNGGFKGAWITENSLTDEPAGKVVGIYGYFEPDDGNGYGFFSGLWKNASGRMGGYLKGKYRDGIFSGIWRCLETGAWGPVKGRYYPAPDTEVDAIHYIFDGKWTTTDGQIKGYLKGTWSPLRAVRIQGNFTGQWAYNNQLPVSSILYDGKLNGKYGIAIFKDGTRIQFFRGIWNSRNSEEGRLGGLIVDSKFYGMWNNINTRPQGYLKGVWENNRFKGVWSQFGQSIEGRLWGAYRPFLTTTTVEKQ